MARASTSKFDIGFIGGGNMAEALIRGLVAAGQKPSRVLVAEPGGRRRGVLARRYKVRTTADNADVGAGCPVVVLAVKPQIMQNVLPQLAEHVAASQVFVSIAAGVRLAALEAGLGGKARVIRVMPNTPCLVGQGASVLCGGRKAKAGDVRRARQIFETVGDAHTTKDEAVLDAVTGLSGSGPAYVYLFAESLVRGGIEAGLDEALAAKLAYQTLTGAAAMLKETKQSPTDLRKAVSSPGGTTVAGLGRLAKGNFEKTVREAVKTATKRSVELGRA